MAVEIVPARVQGDGSIEEIVHALELVNERATADVVVLARGGGSLEDLQAFNSEAVALSGTRQIIP
jgi:exodeoxyribonuclease VII large subunit